MVALGQMESSEFFMSTSHDEFRTMQSTWKEEIMSEFVKQKKLEKVSPSQSLTAVVVGLAFPGN